jgi:transposase
VAASRNGRLAAVEHEAASEALRLLSERRLLTWWPSTPGRSRPIGPRASCAAYVLRATPRPACSGAWLRRCCA